MKPSNPLFLLLAILTAVSGCSTPTIQTRTKEKSDAYARLSPEYRDLVDKGMIKVGMPADGVYIAWGKPSQILQSESPQGLITSWAYHGTSFEEYRYWTYETYGMRRPYSSAPVLQRDYLPRDYVRAEVIFKDGAVVSWQTLPRPSP